MEIRNPLRSAASFVMWFVYLFKMIISDGALASAGSVDPISNLAVGSLVPVTRFIKLVKGHHGLDLQMKSFPPQSKVS